MFLNIAICDDDIEIREHIKSYIENYQIAFDHDFHIDLFVDGVTLLSSEILSRYNILFLDVEMPMLSGIETAKVLREEIAPAAKIIFISNYPEYMQSSFSVHPYHYLQKPITREILFDVLNGAIRDIEKEHVFITFTLPDLSVKTMSIHDLIYIESDDSRKRIVSVHSIGLEFSAKGILTEYEEKLRGKSFIRCHKSFLVNIFHIHYLKKSEIILDTGEAVPTGRSYASELRARLSRMVFQSE
ncbi:MAG: LytTR family DNA-binding domain-containing protein [Eubacterium sp.]|nr:LytTR family DNA-binding domain-containing protein [Eubacterium sp.]